MELFSMDLYLSGLQQFANPPAMFLSSFLGGVLVGIVFGALPGLTATMTIAVFIPPFTFGMSPYISFAFLLGGCIPEQCMEGQSRPS